MTPRQKKVLDFISEYILLTGGVAPTIREMCTHVGTSSIGSMHSTLSHLIEDGHLTHQPGRPRSFSLPIHLSPKFCIHCGNRPYSLEDYAPRKRQRRSARSASEPALASADDGARRRDDPGSN